MNKITLFTDNNNFQTEISTIAITNILKAVPVYFNIIKKILCLQINIYFFVNIYLLLGEMQ